jgi:acyl carrier protein
MKTKRAKTRKETSPTIEEKLEQFVIHEERLKVKSIAYDAHLSLSGLLDSLSFATLLMFVHKEFSVFINFQETSIDEIDTIQKLADFIRKQQARKRKK